MRTDNNWLSRACLCLAFVLAAGASHAQGWPTKPVRIIVPNGPGAVPDLLTRVLADRLSKALSAAFVIENNTAGAGLVAAQAVARAAPDGYTFGVGTVTTLALNPAMYSSLPYRPESDFVGAAMVYDTGSQVVAVHPDVPVKSLAELIALAKSQPGKLSYAADRGLASVVGEWMKKTAGIDMALIPYKVVSQSLTDTASGRIQAIIISVPAIDNLRKAGKLRVIALSSAKRFPGLPDVPTMAETLPGFHASGWSALVGPAATPVEVLQRLNRAVEQVVRETDYRERLLPFGVTTEGAGTLEWIANFFRSEREKWGKIIREVGVKPE
jgi:tripartite-type tricarboxylate transporter receptor subunit TctC